MRSAPAARKRRGFTAHVALRRVWRLAQLIHVQPSKLVTIDDLTMRALITDNWERWGGSEDAAQLFKKILHLPSR